MPAKHARETQFTLLYVEDEDVTRETVLTLLGRRFPSLTLHSATNGAQGLQMFEEIAPDLVITDIRMPVLSGIDMARQLIEAKPSLPVIVTSAHSDMNYLIDSIELGIFRYVLKPIDSQKLFAAIDSALATLRIEREHEQQQAYIRKLSQAVEQSPCSIVITDPKGAVEYVNPKFTALTGYLPEEVLGVDLGTLQKSGDETGIALTGHSEWHGELEGVRKDGSSFYESTSISAVHDEKGVVTNFVAVQEDITERIVAARQIEELNRTLAAHAEDLEIANRDLEGFSYTVSHDLRAPLTNINGYCQVILELYGQTLDQQCKDFIKIIFDETVNMNHLIRTLLEFSRITRSEMTGSPVDLSEMVSLIAANQQLREPGRRLNFRIESGITGYGDPDLLKVVLENLISNAAKYTGNVETPVIEFQQAEVDGERVYCLRDNGAGFDMTQADKLFSPFQRLHSDREFKGFGVGLATVHRIIQRHGGRIWAEAKVGEGAAFYFTLPESGEN